MSQGYDPCWEQVIQAAWLKAWLNVDMPSGAGLLAFNLRAAYTAAAAMPATPASVPMVAPAIAPLLRRLLPLPPAAALLPEPDPASVPVTGNQLVPGQTLIIF